MRTLASAAPATIANCISDTIAANGDYGGTPPPPPAAAASCGPAAWAAAAPTCPPAPAPERSQPRERRRLSWKYRQCPSTEPPGSWPHTANSEDKRNNAPCSPADILCAPQLFSCPDRQHEPAPGLVQRASKRLTDGCASCAAPAFAPTGVPTPSAAAAAATTC
jgi:hypothetical protein